MIVNTSELMHYKTNGAFETFDLDQDFFRGISDTTGLGQLKKDIKELVKRDKQEQMNSQNGQGGSTGSQNGDQPGQQGQQRPMGGQQGQNGGQQGQNGGQNDSQQGQNGGQMNTPGLGGTTGGQGDTPGLGNTLGGQSGSQGGTPGLGNTLGGQGGSQGGTPGGQGGSQGGQGGSQGGQAGSTGGQGGPLNGLNPFGGDGIGKNKDPNTKGYTTDGTGRREPFSEDEARLGAQAIYEQQKYFKDIDDNPRIAKDSKKAIEDYKYTMETIKSVMDRARKLENTYDMGVEGHIKKVLAPKVNWRVLLERFVSKSCESIMTYSRPDRRFVATQVLPGPKFTDDMIKDMIIGIDTSGSITDAELSIAAGHIWNIFKKYKVNAEVAYWDMTCSDGVILKSKSDIRKIPSPPHTGGTNVDCLFQWLNTRMRRGSSSGKHRRLEPSVLLIFTDGEFSAPTILPACGGDKVIWVLTTPAEYHKFQVPFGQKALLDFNNLE